MSSRNGGWTANTRSGRCDGGINGARHQAWLVAVAIWSVVGVAEALPLATSRTIIRDASIRLTGLPAGTSCELYTNTGSLSWPYGPPADVHNRDAFGTVEWAIDSPACYQDADGTLVLSVARSLLAAEAGFVSDARAPEGGASLYLAQNITARFWFSIEQPTVLDVYLGGSYDSSSTTSTARPGWFVLGSSTRVGEATFFMQWAGPSVGVWIPGLFGSCASRPWEPEHDCQVDHAGEYPAQTQVGLAQPGRYFAQVGFSQVIAVTAFAVSAPEPGTGLLLGAGLLLVGTARRRRHGAVNLDNKD